MIYETATLTFPRGTTTWMKVLCDYFNQFSNRFVATNSDSIIFDNKVEFAFTDSVTPSVYILQGSNVIANLGSWGRWNRVSSKTYGIVKFILTESVFYLTLTQTEGGAVWYDCSGNFAILIDDNNKYLAGFTHENFTLDVDVFTNVNDIAPSYRIGKMFNFNTEAQKILVGNICPIYSLDGYSSNISGLVPCSNVTQGITITISGNNYYTIGTNTLLPLDSE